MNVRIRQAVARSHFRRLLLESLEDRVMLDASPWQNPLVPCDVDHNGTVTTADQTALENFLSIKSGPVPVPKSPNPDSKAVTYYDVDDNWLIDERDLALVIDFLENPPGPAGPIRLAGHNSLSGASGPSGPPTVEIETTDSEAREVGRETGEFTFWRWNNSSGSLVVNFTITGSATNGIDYDTLQTSITIPSGMNFAKLTVAPVTDLTIEGIETVVITISASPTYAIGEYSSGLVNIRDRAGVKKLVATAGITGIPAGPGTWRDVTGGELTLTQDDTVDFLAIPTDGGDFENNEPTWTVTGGTSSTGATRTVTFGTYSVAGFTVAVTTPVDASPKSVFVEIVPYPTGIAGTAVVAPSTVYLPGFYGTKFVHTLIPSSGATGDDLDMHDDLGLLELREFVTHDPPFQGQPDIDLPAPISPGGKLIDLIGTPVTGLFPLNAWSIPTSGGTPLVTPQDFLWRSKAPDTLNTGWHEFVSNNDVRVTLSSSANGYLVTTIDNGVPFAQPYFASGSAAHLVALADPPTIPLGGTIDMRLTGTVRIYAADIAAGTKTFTLTIYDDDPIFDEPLQSVTVTVPAANGVAAMYTPFYVVTTLSNAGHIVVGALGSSGQQDPWVYFQTPDGTYSPDVQVFAE